MSWKFYVFIFIALLAVAGVVYVKVAAKVRAKKALDDYLAALKKAHEDAERAKNPTPPQAEGYEIIEDGSWVPRRGRRSSFRDLSDEELEKIVSGK